MYFNSLHLLYNEVMQKTTTLQTKVPTKTYQDASLQARLMGFHSLESAIEKFIQTLSNKMESVTGVAEPKAEYVSLSSRAKKRYKKMENDTRLGKNIHTAHSLEELLNQLHF